jgi:hypothetical protein
MSYTPQISGISETSSPEEYSYAQGFNSIDYITKSVGRLEIFADRRLKTRQDICIALATHGYLLRPRQLERLRVWCQH